jgi:hypothetical protein
MPVLPEQKYYLKNYGKSRLGMSNEIISPFLTQSHAKLIEESREAFYYGMLLTL